MVWLGRLKVANLNRSVEVGRGTVATDVLDGVLLDAVGLDREVGPRLDGLAVNSRNRGVLELGRPAGGVRGDVGLHELVDTSVVDVVALELVGRENGPPDAAVDNLREELRQRLGHGWCRRLGAHGEEGNQLEDRVVAVHVGAGEGEGRSHRGDGRVEDDLERRGDVVDVHGEDLGLSVVELEQDGVLGSRVQEPVLTTEHATRTDNGGVGEGVTNSTLAGVLGPVELGSRRGVGVQVRDVDELVNTRLGSDLGDETSGLDVDVLVAEVTVWSASAVQGTRRRQRMRYPPSVPVTAGKVVDGIGVTDSLVDLVRVPAVPLERNDLAEVTRDLEVALRVLVAVGDNDLGALLGELRDKVAAEESSCAEDGDSVAGNGRTTADRRSLAGDGDGLVRLRLVKDGQVVRRLLACQRELSDDMLDAPEPTCAARPKRPPLTGVRELQRGVSMHSFGLEWVSQCSPKRADTMVASVACL